MTLLAGACLIAVIVWLVNAPESGVKMANEMDAYALKLLAREKILQDSEKLICYFDETISMNGSEAAILTNQRVIYYKEGRTTAIALNEIGEVQHHQETLIGDVIEIVARNGERMKIEIAPFNGGDQFLKALEEARRKRSEEPTGKEPGPIPD